MNNTRNISEQILELFRSQQLVQYPSNLEESSFVDLQELSALRQIDDLENAGERLSDNNNYDLTVS